MAKVVYDDDANIFHGEVINIRDVITFEGSSVLELQNSFKESIDDYLDFCKIYIQTNRQECLFY